MVIGLTQVEKSLMEVGLAGMTLEEKNDLVSVIARKENKSYFEIDEDFILNYHKNLKKDVFSEISDETIVNGFVSSNGYSYRTNRDDQLNMIGKALQLVLKPDIPSVSFRTNELGYIDHDRDEWIDKVYIEGLEHKENTLAKYNMLKYQTSLANTEPELLSVKWDNESGTEA